MAEYLDERRLIGTTIELKPCRFRGLSVVVNLQARPLADTARVEEDVAHALYTYLNPLVGGDPTGRGGGWPFGRAVGKADLYPIVEGVEGVDRITELGIIDEGKRLRVEMLKLQDDELPQLISVEIYDRG